MIHLGDCVAVMAGMEADSVDAVVTDPPYLLQFMGKSWDGPAQMSGHSDPTLAEGHGGKAHDHGVTGHWQPHWMQRWHEAWGREALRVTKPGGYLLAFGGTRTHHRLVCGLEDAGWIIRDELTWVYASGFPKGKANLKPAHEPIVLARKPGPLRPLAIDACRIPGPKEGDPDRFLNSKRPTDRQFGKGGENGDGGMFDPGRPIGVKVEQNGRWPSNLLLQDPELFDTANPYVVGSGAVTTAGAAGVKGSSGFAEGYDGDYTIPYGDTGGYSRFFIIPKADRADREPVLRPDGHERGKRFSTHPTMKPTDLMRHLIRLVTPSGGTILDPFLGSGTTGIAAELEGFSWIGVEKEPEYVAIAEARLNGVQRGLGLDVPAPTQTRKPSKGHWSDPETGSPSFGDTGFTKGKRNWRLRQASPPEEAA